MFLELQPIIMRMTYMLLSVRMCISYEFRRFIPIPSAEVSGLFNRRKAEEWRKFYRNMFFEVAI